MGYNEFNMSGGNKSGGSVGGDGCAILLIAPLAIALFIFWEELYQEVQLEEF